MSRTSVTSVSVSKEFKDILDKYKFSPTEVFRRGLAVMLYDRGIKEYQTELNRLRSEKISLIQKEISAIDRLKTELLVLSKE
jgi:hypothetical protein